MNALFFAAAGTAFPFIMTVLGASTVFFFKTKLRPTLRQAFLGFAAGVMLAASVWSLLNPAIAAAEDLGLPGWLPAAGGLICGVIFLLLSDIAAAHLAAVQTCSDADTASVRKSERHRIFLLQLAMTLHNIPEGMAVGLSFALAAQSPAFSAANIGTSLFSFDTAALSAAMALSLGIGIQNFPEGAAVSLPLLQDGMPAWKAFFRGCISGLVEPVFGLLIVLFVGEAITVMPWLLSFAAGAMLYVVAEELIPEANSGDGSSVSFVGTISTMTGFLLMMILDVALG